MKFAAILACLLSLQRGHITSGLNPARLLGEAAMKARLIGFEATTSTPLTFQALWSHLRTQNHEAKYGQAKRLIYLDEHDGHAYGLLLTTKSHKKACELVNSDGTLTISVTSVADNSERIDFNFIVARMATQKGLYLQYRGSWNINSFGNFLHSRYSDASRAAREQAVESSNAPKSGKKAKQIREKYKKPELELKVIVREQKLAELLNRLNSIQSFDFPLSTLTMKSKNLSRCATPSPLNTIALSSGPM